MSIIYPSIRIIILSSVSDVTQCDIFKFCLVHVCWLLLAMLARIIPCGQPEVKKSVYFWNRCENRNCKTTLWSKTFDFTYWGTFSTPNSKVFVHENFFKVWWKNNFKKKNLWSKNFRNSKNPEFFFLFWMPVWKPYSKKLILKNYLIL